MLRKKDDLDRPLQNWLVDNAPDGMPEYIAEEFDKSGMSIEAAVRYAAANTTWDTRVVAALIRLAEMRGKVLTPGTPGYEWAAGTVVVTLTKSAQDMLDRVDNGLARETYNAESLRFIIATHREAIRQISVAMAIQATLV